jgi:(S)-3,5-dihydroxyphenylglycine transaminase
MNLSSQADVMNFLNEVADDFPSAISLAAGRPTDRFFGRLDSEALTDAMICYERHCATGSNPRHVKAGLLQYGRTAGIITDLVACQLRADEGVCADPDRMLITAGCQEAIALCLSALCPNSNDVVLVCNPTYVGVMGAARASKVNAFPIDDLFSDPVESIEKSVGQLQRSGKCVRALYLIPTFDNPTGRTLSQAMRKDLLEICTERRIIILEDNPYGMFRYEGDAIPPMAALDESGCVIYLSTYSKTLTPAVRVGAATLPETLFGDRAARTALWRDLVQRKSFNTVNTSQIAQAIVGGLLIAQNGSLQRWIQPALAWYRSNRDAMLSQLQAAFSTMSDHIHWSNPSGGFFLSVDLPFRFDAQNVVECATSCGVIVMPMSFFALDHSQDHRIRLAFSGLDASNIRAAISSLALYVKRRVTNDGLVLESGHPGISL